MNLAHHGEIGLLGDPPEHPDPVIKGGGVAALGREPVADGDDDGVAELGDPPAEGVVGGGAVAPRDEAAAVELPDDGQPAARGGGGPRGGDGAREGAPVGRARLAGGGVAGAARVEEVRGVRRRRGQEDADGERRVGVDVQVLGGDPVGCGEGRVGRRRGLVGAAGDPEGGRVAVPAAPVGGGRGGHPFGLEREMPGFILDLLSL